MQNKTGKQWFFSSFLLLAGAALLLANIGVFSFQMKEVTEMIMPAVFLIIGVMFCSKVTGGRIGTLLPGLFFSVYGLLLILRPFNFIQFSYGDWWKLWPILIIYIAIIKLRFKERNVIHEASDRDGVYEDIQGNEMNSSSWIGDYSFGEENWPLKSMNLNQKVGNYFLDLSKAFIPEEEVVLKIRVKVGDVQILIPEDIPVSIYSNVKVGDVQVLNRNSSGIKPNGCEFTSQGYEEAIKKIKFHIDVKIGSIRVDRV